MKNTIKITREDGMKLLSYLQNTIPRCENEKDELLLVKRSYELDRMLSDLLDIEDVSNKYIDIVTLKQKEY